MGKQRAFINKVEKGKIEDSSLSDYKKQINYLKSEISYFNNNRANDISRLEEKKDNLSIKKEAMQLLNQDESIQIQHLGYRPSGVNRTYVVGKKTIKREGFFGWITDWVCGEQKIDITKNDFDDSEGKNWDYKKNIINQQYDIRRREYQNEIEELNDEIESLENSLERNIKGLKNAEKKLKETKDKMDKRMKEEKEILRKIALEYLDNLRKSLIEQMNNYKESSFNYYKKELINIINNKIKVDLKKEAFNLFDKALNDFIKMLKEDKKESDNELDSLISVYETLSSELYKYINQIGVICND